MTSRFHVATLIWLQAAVGACADAPVEPPAPPPADVATAMDIADIGADQDSGDVGAAVDVVHVDGDASGDVSAPDLAGSDVAGPDLALPPEDEVCAESDAFPPQYAAAVARFQAQDGLEPREGGGVVFAGSSSIRRWEGLLAAYSDFAPVIQRGLGGASLAEIAQSAHVLVTRHNPRAVVVYAGTNDLNAGVPVDMVVDRFLCLRRRVADALGVDRPVVFVGVTPSPARWEGWPVAREFNDAIAALAAEDPALVFVDVAPAFLATGSPPAEDLFVGDRLHLSASGYALWDRLIRAALVSAIPPNPPGAPSASQPVSGARVLVDLGPDNPEDGQATASPDPRGYHWNNWHPVEGGVTVLAGERLGALRTTDGTHTGIDLVIAGAFIGNGRVNGGLVDPDPARLGDLALGSATGDYFYVSGGDAPGALALTGLDPARTYRLRLFAARKESEPRTTRYTVRGAGEATTLLQTSGAGAGASGSTTNDDTIATLDDLRPDPWGQLFVDVAIERGTYAYLALLELTVF